MKHLPTKIMLLSLTGAAILADTYFTLIKKDSDTQAATQTVAVAQTNQTATQSNSQTNTQTEDSTSRNTSQNESTPTTSASDNTTTSSTYKDGTYTGSSTSTRWGDVQVQITIQNGVLSNVDVLSYPTNDRKSQMINQQALPTYKQEAIDAQSSSIQLVSGATETYNGFTGSLQDALNQALS
ncbi:MULTISPECIES: FMN-binding protein [Enterococcus]|uniref:FMN-binding domain-containing protein n=1 Tax=Enterococcus sulfureus ATCC 49903 TaxID=1140003 RepID=S0NP48_9ENTE|nr:FMN-binding protein [Enterococcus sulfureus]EOT45930.1 hypothetical protein OMY_01951 [Enterococcus sulfureus ATCC 49903]EOT83019.1 hypothetical protein I573_02132 [Enterococcus sulfureus ATCC 49903]